MSLQLPDPLRVAVASLGGTITMTSDRSDGRGVVPSLTAADLLRSVPSLAHVEVESATLATVPGASLGLDDLFAVLTWARAVVDAGADGVVVVQGTDTIEETAYLLDLYWDRSAPLVVTGAMRSPQAPGADGPANLSAAVVTATSAGARDRGVLVVMADQVHAAARVRKTRSSGPDVFRSDSFGPLGHVDEGAVAFGGPAWRPSPLTTGAPDRPVLVPLLETFLGDDGRLLEIVDDAGCAGIVVAGFGVGHVSAGLAAVVGRVVERRPVVVATRTGAGTTYTSTYGFPGSESDLIARGAVLSGSLDPRKSRLLLTCLLGSGAGAGKIADEFRRRGARGVPA
ncbi:asparaginase [Microlunatus antarcticus]|uniref:L-asparaginase n=1 Tax=Microlunatus antarcticus TaxID=53388 RepID=A0A7W5JWU3_9ACTN|nr:asparaginase [Microlunatus antarcticus]MBB3327536.1 L-asparaginase [Microlunatus antarcticus]